MKLQHLTVGDSISHFGKLGNLAYSGSDFAVIEFIDKTSISISQFDLFNAYKEGGVQIVRRPCYNPCHVKLDINQKNEIVRFESYCNELHKEPLPCAKGVRESIILRVSSKINDSNPPSKSYLHKIYKRWLGCGKNMHEVLFGRNRQRSTVISDQVYSLMDEVIEKEYLGLSKTTARKAYKIFRNAYFTSQYDAPCPSISTFERRIKSVDRLHLIKGRYGKSAAREEGRSATSKINIKHILEVVSMDAAHFNIGLKNNNGDYIGMPTIYFVMDDYSRVILGYGIHVGVKEESTACVVHTLRYAISKKADPLYEFYGLPATILIDQGVAYASEDAVKFFGALQVNITKTATRMGWGKPMIERFIGTARSRFFSGLEGYLGKRDTKISSDKTIKEAAHYTLSEFRNYFSEFILEYHNTPHSGLNGKTPTQVWRENKKIYPPILIEDIPHTQLLRGVHEEKILKHPTGITCDYQIFNSEELQRLYHSLEPSRKPGARSKIKVTIYRDPLDASAINVVDPKTNFLIEVPNITGDVEGQSFSDLRTKRKSRTTAEESPVFDGGVREGYSRTKRRKGPDVPLDDFDNPIDLNEVLKSPSKSIASNNSGHEDRSQTDEEDDYVVIE